MLKVYHILGLPIMDIPEEHLSPVGSNRKEAVIKSSSIEKVADIAGIPINAIRNHCVIRELEDPKLFRRVEGIKTKNLEEDRIYYKVGKTKRAWNRSWVMLGEEP